MVRALVAMVLVAVVAPPAHAGRGANLVKYLPDDAQAILVVDVARARKSSMFKKLFDVARQKNDTLDNLASSIAVDKLVDTAVIGASAATGKVVVVLEGRIDKLLAEAKKTSTKEDKHGGVTYWTNADGELAVVDKRFVVTTAGEMEHVIDRAQDKKAKGPAAMRTILGAASGSASAFGGTLLDADQKKELAGDLGAEPQWAAFSFGLAAKLTLDGKIKLADDAAAQTAAKTINDKLGAPGIDGTVRSRLEGFVGKELADSIQVAPDHSFARVTATMASDEVDKVLTLATMFM